MSSDSDFMPELGDLITIKSSKYGSIVGRIVYRSESLLRVKPRVTMGTTDRLYEFPMDPESGLFLESVGVDDLEIHEKRRNPAFVNQLGIFTGMMLKLVRLDGTSEEVRILDIQPDIDALTIQRGDHSEQITFEYVGPPAPYVYAEAVVPDSESEPIPTVVAEEPFPEPEFDITLLLSPGAVEEVPSSEKLYSRDEQLEDMILSLKTEYTVEEQEKNKRLLTLLQNQAQVFLTLKEQSKEIEPITTLLELINHQPHKGDPINSILPVIDARRYIYTNDDADDTELVGAKNELAMFNAAMTAFQEYETGSTGSGHRYIEYIKKILELAPGLHGSGDPLHSDQEVFRGPPITTDMIKTKGLPDLSANNDKFKNKKLTNNYVTDVSHTIYRIVGCATFTNDEQVKINLADADLFNPLQYLVLPPSLARQRCSFIQNGVLLWDVHQSEELRTKTNFSNDVISSFSTDSTLEKVYNLEETLLIKDVLKLYLTQPYYSLSDIYLLNTMDGFGFRQLDWTPTEFGVITSLLDKYQSKWSQEYIYYSKKISSMPTTSNNILDSTIDTKSPLLTSIESTPLIEIIVKNLKTNESHIGTHDLTITNALHGGPERLWFTSAAAITDPTVKSHVEAEESILKSEQSRIKQEEETRIAANKLLRAEPILNSCEHVKELELIRGIEIESERMILLEAFINKYREGLTSNWIQCNICHNDLICKHEELTLQTYKSEYNRGVLHKTLIIEFGELQYNDSYICKNCGIAIGEMEYANSLDFNKEGVLLQGRTVLDMLEVGDVLLLEEQKENKFKEKKPFRETLQILFETAGANPSDAIYTRCTEFAYAQYLNLEKKFIKELKNKNSPESIQLGLQIVVCAAIVIIELQISEKDIPILYTAQGCTFSRDGFPRDKDGVGLLNYIGCITSRITILSEPWSGAYWQSRPYGPDRTNYITKNIEYGIKQIIIVPQIADGLQKAREQIQQLDVLEEAPTFRPRISSSPDAISNLASIALEPIILRSEVLSHQIIETAHSVAMKTHRPLRGQNKRLDGQCCEIKLSDMNTFGIVGMQPEGIQHELDLLKQGEIQLNHQGGVSNTIVPWSAPFSMKVEANADESVLSRLFLKACTTTGLPHEYGYNRTCRRCGFHYSIELLDLAVDEQYYLEKEATTHGKSLDAIRTKLQEIASEKNKELQTAIKDATINSDKEGFNQLQDIINNKHRILVQPAKETIEWIDHMSIFLSSPIAMTVLQPKVHDQWEIFKNFYKSSTSDRSSTFNTFSGFYSEYRDAIKRQYATLKCTGVTNTMMDDIIETLRTVQSPIKLITLFVQPLQQIASGIKLTLRGGKWFGRITSSYKAELDKIWNNQYKIIDTIISGLVDASEPELRTIIKLVLNRYTAYIGRVLSMFITSIRVSSRLQKNEQDELLRWFLLSSIYSLMNPNSVVYASETVTSDLRKRSSKMICCYIALIINNITNVNKRLNKTEEEITFAIDSRNQAERERFIETQTNIDIVNKRADNLFKHLGIGPYSEGALKKNIGFDADFHEFHTNQRAEYGFTDFSSSITGVSQEEVLTTHAFDDATVDMINEYEGQNDEA